MLAGREKSWDELHCGLALLFDQLPSARRETPILRFYDKLPHRTPLERKS